MIKYSNIHVVHDRVLLENETVILYPGKVTLIIGESGSGKTTLLERIGLIVPDCKVEVNNEELNDYNEYRRTKIGFVLQSDDIFNYLSVEDNLRLYASIVSKEITKENIINILQEVKLDVPLDQNAIELSLGERQRLAIACALIKDPDILILDEPTASLDKYHKIEIFELINSLSRKGIYVVLTSHDKSAIPYANNIYEIKDRKLNIIKSSNENNEYPNKQGYPLKKISFIKYYSHLFSKYYKNINLMTAVLIILNIFTISIINTSINRYHQSTIEQLYSQSEQILFINKSNEEYIDNINKPFTYNSNPYIKMTYQGYYDIYIVPYFEDDTFNDKLEIQIDNSNDGIYISHDLYKKDIGISLEKDIDLPLTIFCGNGKVNNTVYSTHLNGVLKKGVNQYYSKEKSLFIYMPYKTMVKLYNQNFNYNQYYAYIVKYDDYNDLKENKELLEKKGYSTTVIGIDYNHLNSTIESNSKMMTKINIIMIIISTLILIALDLYILHKRNKEICLLVINGMPNSVISTIILFQNFKVIILSILVGLLTILLKANDLMYFIYTILYIVLIQRSF